MNNFLKQNSPSEISKKIALKIKKSRKKQKISQNALALKSGVPLGTIKRFETKCEISLISLIKIAIALNMEDSFDDLFEKKFYSTIDEVINE